jgi:hypothetical protein
VTPCAANLEDEEHVDGRQDESHYVLDDNIMDDNVLVNKLATSESDSSPRGIFQGELEVIKKQLKVRRFEGSPVITFRRSYEILG